MNTAPKIYTRQGDAGLTSLPGRRVRKDSPIVSALGDLDEACAILGVVRARCKYNFLKGVKRDILRAQETLFNIGVDISFFDRYVLDAKSIYEEVKFLEERIDYMGESLPSLSDFIIPGDQVLESYLHLSRTVVRRAERSIVSLCDIGEVKISDASLSYVNRLSDYLFQSARYVKFLFIRNKPFIVRKNYDNIWKKERKMFHINRKLKIAYVK